jgi:YesN/AraC family two-component response regulator
MLTYNLTNIGSDSLYEYLYKCIKKDIILGNIKPGENTKEIYKIIEEIEKRYNQDLTLEIIAEQFHFHPFC